MFKHVLVSAFLFSISLTIVGCASKDTENSKVTQDGIAKPISFWWPERLDLGPLRQHTAESNPYGDKFDYAKEFKKVNLDEVKKDITKALTTTQDWWPADWGNYGPFFIRMAWHSTGTYRVTDGRGGAGGGQQRFEPLNSWPDNANLDKARRLLWPVKAKYGRKLSWADIMVLAGNVSMESMGFKTLGFAGGRADDWEADLVYWGSETKMLDSNRHHHGKDYSKKDYKGKRKLKRPLGATRMGLIYVNPEGPNGNHDPLSSAADIRENFARMAMNDEETLALIAGGHTFGKAHGAHKPSKCVGAEPAAAGIEEQGLGWKNKCGKGHSEDTVTSGLEGAWTSAPTMWTHQYLTNLLDFEWEKTQSPAGATQWIPKNGALKNVVRDAHVKRKSTSPIMLTSDMALKVDPEYRKIAERFKKDPKEFELAFAKAWFKLTHRDMGPRTRYIGKDAPKIVMNWQDPVPAVNHSLIGSADIARLKKDILKSGLTTSELIRTAWASASSFRNTDMRGGANGARIQLAPQKDWAVNNPKELKRVLEKLKEVKKNFNKKVSLADVIVLGGTAAVENAAKKAGVRVNVSFKPGRTDATQSQTNIESFSNLEPKADAFRNYYSKESLLSPTQMLVDKANVLSLTIPEMTVLIGGMRVLSANVDGNHGVLTKTPGTLSNDFFVNLLDMSTKWRRSANEEGVYEGINRKSGTLEWTATPVDLIFGSHTELRAVAEVYAANDGKTKFVRDFAKAWSKVMQLDRFELK
jgi:catalase-peroxidase